MTIVRDWEWEKKNLISPVTSVEFLRSDLLLSGEKETLLCKPVVNQVVVVISTFHFN